ncbi:MAG TPA: GAF domain-containing SpoIIE family protein phosphatase [Rhodothermales bacterium]
MNETTSRDPVPKTDWGDVASLLEVARKLGATLDLDTLVAEIQEAALSTLQCERVSLFLFDTESDELWSRFATGSSEIRFPASAGIAGETLSSGRVINVPDAYRDVRFNPEVDRTTGFVTRSILSVPMFGYDGTPVGVLQVLNKKNGAFTEHDESVAETFCSLTGVVVQRQLLLMELEEKQKLMRDLAVARGIQQSFLPDHAPVVDGYSIAGWNRPAEETGGDCYDFVEFPENRAGFLLADATGHGIGPALMASQCRALIRGVVSATGDLSEAIETTNRILNKDLRPGLFLTVFLGYLDHQASEIRYVSAGQGPILLFRRRTGERILFDATTTPLGIFPFIDASVSEPVKLEPGDVFVVASDGFFEWQDPDGEEFGTDRMFDMIERAEEASASDIIHLTRSAVVEFARGTKQDDDLTVVVVVRSKGQ